MKLLGDLVLKLGGWHTAGGIDPSIKKGVLIGAHHTSNWDFVWAMAALYSMRVPVQFLAKKELFKAPLGWLMYAMGGIPVDRSKHNNLVDAMAAKIRESDRLIVLIPPSGTRSAKVEWKSGFYHVAQLAGVPIFRGYLDYAKKEAGIAAPFYPTGDYEKDYAELREWYEGVTPKDPSR